MGVGFGSVATMGLGLEMGYGGAMIGMGFAREVKWLVSEPAEGTLSFMQEFLFPLKSPHPALSTIQLELRNTPTVKSDRRQEHQSDQ